MLECRAYTTLTQHTRPFSMVPRNKSYSRKKPTKKLLPKKDPVYIDGIRPRPMFIDYKDLDLLSKLTNRHGRISVAEKRAAMLQASMRFPKQSNGPASWPCCRIRVADSVWPNELSVGSRVISRPIASVIARPYGKIRLA